MQQSQHVMQQVGRDRGRWSLHAQREHCQPMGRRARGHGQCIEYEQVHGVAARQHMALEVANAAEETRPRAALELYQQHAESLIAQQGRQNYQQACRYLATVRRLYERLGESEAWARYIADLRERNRRLRALMEELAAAGL